MLRGFATTLAVVTTLMMGAWAYSEQSQMASASTSPDAAMSSVVAAAAPKSDRLAPAVANAGGYGIENAEGRIIQAHARVIEANGRYHTVAKQAGPRTTVLVRVPAAD